MCEMTRLLSPWVTYLTSGAHDICSSSRKEQNYQPCKCKRSSPFYELTNESFVISYEHGWEKSIGTGLYHILIFTASANT